MTVKSAVVASAFDFSIRSSNAERSAFTTMLNAYAGVNWAAVVPLANESDGFATFASSLANVMDELGSGHVFLVIDGASKDNTRALIQELVARDDRFEEIWAPENRNVVDAYLRGFRASLDAGYELTIEMDAGMSHDPAAIPMFLRVLHEGNECAFGSRYINGGSMVDSPWKRRALSKGGTIVARLLLGVQLRDLTSGFQGFHRDVLTRLLAYPLRSKAHFYQTEVRYLLRHTRLIEVPIHYRAPSPRVSSGAIKNSITVLWHYTMERLFMRAPSL